jgi:hypothetical protein
MDDADDVGCLVANGDRDSLGDLALEGSGIS